MLKVELVEDGNPFTYQALEAVFDAILDQPCESKTSLATLTADDRDSWAKISLNDHDNSCFAANEPHVRESVKTASSSSAKQPW